jgi:hypothetical protein
MKIFGYPGWYKDLPADRYTPHATPEDKARVDALFLEMAESDRRADRDLYLWLAWIIGPLAAFTAALYVIAVLT